MNDAYKLVPHGEVIKKDSTVVIPSIFMFKGGAGECYPFLKMSWEAVSVQ